VPQDEDHNYAVIKINHQTHVALTVDIVNGQSAGETAAARRGGELTEAEKKDGWTFYTELTTRRVWSTPTVRFNLKARKDRKCA
jgi:hypothetical protein